MKVFQSYSSDFNWFIVHWFYIEWVFNYDSIMKIAQIIINQRVL